MSDDQTISLWRHETITPATAPTMKGIARRIAEKYGLSPEDLQSPKRTRDIVRPRQEAMHEMYQTGRWSYPRIARFFGGMDHTTVIHGVRRHAERLAG
jgi:chromosomal replication initiator protein